MKQIIYCKECSIRIKQESVLGFNIGQAPIEFKDGYMCDSCYQKRLRDKQ